MMIAQQPTFLQSISTTSRRFRWMRSSLGIVVLGFNSATTPRLRNEVPDWPWETGQEDNTLLFPQGFAEAKHFLLFSDGHGLDGLGDLIYQFVLE